MSVNNTPSLSLNLWPFKEGEKLIGFSHLEDVYYNISVRGRIVTRSGVRDVSTGLIYFDDPRLVVSVKGALVFLSTPLYLAAAIAYNVFRLVIVVLYSIGSYFYDSMIEGKSFKQITVEQWDVLKTETLRSIINIIRDCIYAPLYALSAAYTIICPYNGRKMVAAYEKEWNHGISVDKSIHLFAPRDKWDFTLLGENGYYIPGCFQPIAQTEPGPFENTLKIWDPDDNHEWSNFTDKIAEPCCLIQLANCFMYHCGNEPVTA